jgi:hypothetical protein
MQMTIENLDPGENRDKPNPNWVTSTTFCCYYTIPIPFFIVFILCRPLLSIVHPSPFRPMEHHYDHTAPSLRARFYLDLHANDWISEEISEKS